MSTQYKVGLAALLLVAAFAFGRYSAPEKVRIETKTVEVEKKTDVKDSDSSRDLHRETTVTEVTRPDGSKEKTTKTVDDYKGTRKSQEASTDTAASSTTQVKEVTKSKGTLNVSILAAINVVDDKSVTYGASISRNLIGPITVGLFGLTNGTGGVSVGLNF